MVVVVDVTIIVITTTVTTTTAIFEALHPLIVHLFGFLVSALSLTGALTSRGKEESVGLPGCRIFYHMRS